jgi:hypothetical protein
VNKIMKKGRRGYKNLREKAVVQGYRHFRVRLRYDPKELAPYPAAEYPMMPFNPPAGWGTFYAPASFPAPTGNPECRKYSPDIRH